MRCEVKAAKESRSPRPAAHSRPPTSSSGTQLRPTNSLPHISAKALHRGPGRRTEPVAQKFDRRTGPHPVQLQSVIQKPSNSGAPSCSRRASTRSPPRPPACECREPWTAFDQRDHCQRTDLALTVEGLSCPASSTDRTQVDHPYRLARLHRLLAERAPTSPITRSTPTRGRHPATFRRNRPAATTRPARRPRPRIRAGRMR